MASLSPEIPKRQTARFTSRHSQSPQPAPRLPQIPQKTHPQTLPAKLHSRLSARLINQWVKSRSRVAKINPTQKPITLKTAPPNPPKVRGKHFPERQFQVQQTDQNQGLRLELGWEN